MFRSTAPLLSALMILTLAAPGAAQTSRRAPPTEELLRVRARALMERGANYLLADQDADGAWLPQAGPGPTALAVKALAQAPTAGPQHPAVRRGAEFVLKMQRDDGGVYSAEGLLKNYETSVAVSMLAALRDERWHAPLLKARAYLTNLQWDETESIDRDNPWYGGAGYGNSKRPDLSNTQMMLEALRDSGLPPDDPAYKKALVFISRCQMLGETNDQHFARGSTQGGFIYSPHAGGESKAGTVEVGGRSELRCYGSMSYAGYKSLLYAGLKADDPRVRAALEWIRAHWTLDHNPNMPEAQTREGLFYYYHVFARAMAAHGEPIVRDTNGREHDWRRELVDKLASLQRPDGSWVNDADRWMEGNPALVTAYALLALEAAFPE